MLLLFLLAFSKLSKKKLLLRNFLEVTFQHFVITTVKNGNFVIHLANILMC